MTVKTREKKETSESWTTRCRLFTKKKTGKGKWSVRKGQIGTQRRTQVAKMQIVWVFSWQKGSGKKGGKGKEKRGNGDSRVRWTCEKQDTLQRGVHREATKTCVPLKKTREKPLKKHVTMMKSCKRCVCWKEAIMSSDKR